MQLRHTNPYFRHTYIAYYIVKYASSQFPNVFQLSNLRKDKHFLLFLLRSWAEVEEPELISIVEESQEQITPSNPTLSIPQPKNKYSWWACMIIYTLLVLFGQSIATLLGRLYYNNGGNSIFLSALLETIGFPILIPFSLYFSSKNLSKASTLTNKLPNKMITASVYIFLGLFQAASSVLYSIGLQNLPVSTFSLITATQLGFNALFSFFLNAQKFTPPILNALVLLTISSTILVFRSDSQSSSANSKREHFVVGFSCTLAASALYSLMLSMTQVAFHKWSENFSTVLNMIIYQSLVASFAITIPLFTSKEWHNLRNEMENFEGGKGFYVIVVVMITLAWQVFSIGDVGLIFEVSSLFSNVISTVGLPIVPILAAIFFHEKMDGLKVISIVLAIWGFASFVYDHYLNDCKDGNDGEDVKMGIW